MAPHTSPGKTALQNPRSTMPDSLRRFVEGGASGSILALSAIALGWPHLPGMIVQITNVAPVFWTGGAIAAARFEHPVEGAATVAGASLVWAATNGGWKRSIRPAILMRGANRTWLGAVVTGLNVGSLGIHGWYLWDTYAEGKIE